MTEQWEGARKRELAQSIAKMMQEHGLTPLHLAHDMESQARFESILRGDVELFPYITLLRCSYAVHNLISPLKVIDDPGSGE